MHKRTPLSALCAAVFLWLAACAESPASSAARDLDAEVDASGHTHAVDELDASPLSDGSYAHHMRDLATEPCDAETWRALGVDLRQCQLMAEDLEGESLRRVNLSGSDLREANLRGADLFNAKLVDANLDSADLDGARLAGADLSNADLRDATLRGTNLTNATLRDAVLDGAATDATTTCADGTLGPCW